jgi:hypothetical protein
MNQTPQTETTSETLTGAPWPVVPGTWATPPRSNYGFTEKPWWWDEPLPTFGGKEGAGAAARAAIEQGTNGAQHDQRTP